MGQAATKTFNVGGRTAAPPLGEPATALRSYPEAGQHAALNELSFRAGDTIYVLDVCIHHSFPHLAHNEAELLRHCGCLLNQPLPVRTTEISGTYVEGLSGREDGDISALVRGHQWRPGTRATLCSSPARPAAAERRCQGRVY